MVISPFVSCRPNHKINCLEQPLFMKRVNSQAYEGWPAKPLWVRPISCCGCSFVGGLTWRSSVHTARSCCFMRVYKVSVPFWSWDKNVLLFSCLCHSAQPIPFGVTDTFNSDGSPAWLMPRAFICCTRIFGFSKVACCSHPVLHGPYL